MCQLSTLRRRGRRSLLTGIRAQSRTDVTIGWDNEIVGERRVEVSHGGMFQGGSGVENRDSLLKSS